MSKRSVAKGKAGEREVVALLSSLGLHVKRTPNSGGLAWRGDIHGLPDFLIEVKRQERLDIPRWLAQAHEAASGGEVPVVVFRRSARGRRLPDAEWHVIEPLWTWATRLSEKLT